MTYQVTKTYGHNLGLSACFRQPAATSHCKDPHGYPLSFKLTFESPCLNDNNWVIDFGSLKPVKQFLVDTFDHRTLLAEDDPFLNDFQDLYKACGFAPIIVLPRVGCEGFAEYVAKETLEILRSADLQGGLTPGLRLLSVEAREHEANSAIYYPGEQGYI